MRIIQAAPLALLAGALPALSAAAAPAQLAPIQVTATRVAQGVELVPASISVVSGEELRARGAIDLRTALALVAGVEGTPGGDGGPAGSVPAMWGLREVDAFLLVIDGVPAGGAFNPQTAAVDLAGVERIEVLRGAAPVMYGATSFNGVIHIIHYAAGAAPAVASIGGGSHGSWFAHGALSLPAAGDWKQSLTATVEHRGFSVDREEFDRYHALYRGGAGGFHLDADVSVVPQGPGNVTFRRSVGGVQRLSNDLVPEDANHNPTDAKLDQQRYHLAGGYDARLGGSDWGTTLAFTHTKDDIIRGFHAPDATSNASGFTQDREITDVYFDTHLSQVFDTLALTWGVDWLYGKAEQEAFRFPYTVGVDGSNAQSSGQAIASCTPATCREEELEVMRNFLGLYAQANWMLTPDLALLGGLRLNHTREEQEGEDDSVTPPQPESHQRNKTRLAGVIGASFRAWHSGADSLTVYGDYRNTFKPLAVDLGPESESDILEPETSNSYELGVRGHLADWRFSYDASLFQLDFKNLKTQDTSGNTVNAGQTRFKGGELELSYAVLEALRIASSYGYHDSRFVHFNRDGTPGGVVDGRRFEVAPYHVAGLGVMYTPRSGFNATVAANHTGSRLLNKSNTLKAGAFTTIDASAGYRWGRYGVAVNGYNLSDRRDAIAESELSGEISGASAYYLLPARTIMASFSVEL
ncbi:MAG TPA: TonB-dependent receptor [Solimonas sp.]|nr:TonB-dependent receptor [Solimonas sp.]